MGTRPHGLVGNTPFKSRLARKFEPLTILDGNHRVAAAMLAQPSTALTRFQFICGLSTEMSHCCWYSTNVNTLLRYFKNLVRYISYDPESDIGRFQESDS